MIHRVIIVCCILFIFSGCTTLTNLFHSDDIAYRKVELTSCEEKAEPKSLQLLEQQYRCTGN